MNRALRVVCLAAAVSLLVLQSCAADKVKVEIPMQDGTRLIADVHTPAAPGPYPVVLLRSTYGRAFDIEKFLDEGYAVVFQDVRGMGESPGDKYVFHPDGWQPGLNDGADTVKWVTEQEFCNGKIGTWGGSALGITQMLMAPTTDQVAAQYIEAAPSNLYTDLHYIGGVWNKNLLEGWLSMIQQPHLIAVYKSHPYYDDFWTYYNIRARSADITAPMMTVNGWYDIFQQGTIDGFLAREQNGGAGAKGNNYLIMKWSGHGQDTSPDYKYNENRFDLQVSDLQKKFFAYHLKGDTGALDGVAKVHYYVMGDDAPGAPGNEWRTADAWPPYETASTTYYLREGGALSTDAPAAEAAQSFVYDPNDPVPTRGGANLLMPSGPYDQRKNTDTRDDILIFETATLDAPLEITGRVSAKLYISSDAPDTDFTAMLVDVFPDGRRLNVIDSIQRVKLRNGYEKPEPLLTGPDQIVELNIDLWSAAWIFNAGHRVALHVSSSNFPRFEVNPNTGADFPAEGETLPKANNTVHLGASHPSALTLPVRVGDGSE